MGSFNGFIAMLRRYPDLLKSCVDGLSGLKKYDSSIELATAGEFSNQFTSSEANTDAVLAPYLLLGLLIRTRSIRL